MLSTELFHCDSLFLFFGACPNLDIIAFLVLNNIEPLTLLFEDVLVDCHDLVVVQLLISALNVEDLFLANLSDAFDGQLVQNFTSSLLSLKIELIEQLITSSFLLILLFLDLKLA